VTILIILAGS